VSEFQALWWYLFSHIPSVMQFSGTTRDFFPVLCSQCGIIKSRIITGTRQMMSTVNSIAVAPTVVQAPPLQVYCTPAFYRCQSDLCHFFIGIIYVCAYNHFSFLFTFCSIPSLLPPSSFHKNPTLPKTQTHTDDINRRQFG
jgi:hypothetical protein